MDQLRTNIKKNKTMVRRTAPITIGSTGYSKICRKMEEICLKLKEKNRI